MTFGLCFILMSLGACGGTFQHTPQTKRLADLFQSLLGKHGILRKQLASYLNLDEAQLSRQMDPQIGRGPGLFSLPELPVAFSRDFIKQAGAMCGLLVLDSDDVRDVLLHQAYTSARRMAVAELTEREERAS